MVVSSSVNVICELARKNPKNYLGLAPLFFRLLTASSNNWMLIKIVKLFGALTPLERRLGKKLVEPLSNIINNTSATFVSFSFLYPPFPSFPSFLLSFFPSFLLSFFPSFLLSFFPSFLLSPFLLSSFPFL